jgi:hypothetical protein
VYLLLSPLGMVRPPSEMRRKAGAKA